MSCDGSVKESMGIYDTEPTEGHASVTRQVASYVARCSYDDLPEAAFYMVGNIDEARAKAERMAEASK